MTNKAAVNVRETASIAVGIAAISQSVRLMRLTPLSSPLLPYVLYVCQSRPLSLVQIHRDTVL